MAQSTLSDPFTGGDLVDILADIPRQLTIYGERGFVHLIDCCPRNVPRGRDSSFAAARSARQSYDSGLKSVSADRGLVKFLIRNKHTSPLEFANVTFRIKAPIFVVRQFQRHRVWKFSELSRRYTDSGADDFWYPDDWRTQSQTNKQCSEGVIKDRTFLDIAYDTSIKNSYEKYRQLLDSGVGKEQARAVLPVSGMTDFYASIDLHNLLKFMDLRLAWDAQAEIRELAFAMKELAYPIFKDAFDAWEECGSTNTITFSHSEVKALKAGKDLDSSSVTEKAEFSRKRDKWNSWVGKDENSKRNETMSW
jgi:thymidylate synthase (FAD)